MGWSERPNINRNLALFAALIVGTWLLLKFDHFRREHNTKAITYGHSFRDPLFSPLLRVYEANAVAEKLYPDRDIPTFLLVTKRDLTSGFWRQQLIDITAGRCALPCKFTSDVSKVSQVDAVVFYIAAMKSRQHFSELIPNRNLSQPWIMLTFEAPPRANAFYHTKYPEFNGIFNRTASYRRDGDIVIPYGAVFSYEDAKLLPPSWRVPPPREPLGEEIKKMAVAMISNCGAQSNRLDYIHELQKYVQVDVYGKCGNFTCKHSYYVQHGYDIHTDECYQKVASEYLFYMSFENSICKDYVSEKLYNIMHYPIIPVVLGGSVYEEILPPHSYIDALKFKPKELAEYMTTLQNNRTMYNEYLLWRERYQSNTWGGVRPMCHLCARLYDPELYQPKVYEDFNSWFLEESQCSRSWDNLG